MRRNVDKMVTDAVPTFKCLRTYLEQRILLTLLDHATLNDWIESCPKAAPQSYKSIASLRELNAIARVECEGTQGVE